MATARLEFNSLPDLDDLTLRLSLSGSDDPPVAEFEPEDVIEIAEDPGWYYVELVDIPTGRYRVSLYSGAGLIANDILDHQNLTRTEWTASNFLINQSQFDRILRILDRLHSMIVRLDEQGPGNLSVYASDTDQITLEWNNDLWWFNTSRERLPTIIVTPSNTPHTTGWVICYDIEGNPVANVTLFIRIIAGPGSGSYPGTAKPIVSDANGLAEYMGHIRGARYRIRRGNGPEYEYTAPDEDSFELPEQIGKP